VFVMVAGGLMAAAQIAPIAKDFKIADAPVGLLGFRWPHTLAISLDRIFDGFGRRSSAGFPTPLAASTPMFIAFGTGSADAADAVGVRPHPDRVRAGDAVYFGVFGEIYSCFPATSGDTFGVKYATTNTACCTPQRHRSLLVPLASVIATITAGRRCSLWPSAHATGH